MYSIDGSEAVKLLDVDWLKGAARGFLSQSALACEAGDAELMITQARKAERIALARFDPMGEGAALVYLGIGYIMKSALPDALERFSRARHIFRCHPAMHFRANEGLALFLLAVATERQHVKKDAGSLVPVGSARLVEMYEEALTLFIQASQRYAAVGDTRRFAQIQNVCEELRSRVAHCVPRLIIPATPVEPDRKVHVEAEPDI